jgi:hypothetical protein
MPVALMSFMLWRNLSGDLDSSSSPAYTPMRPGLSLAPIRELTLSNRRMMAIKKPDVFRMKDSSTS